MCASEADGILTRWAGAWTVGMETSSNGTAGLVTGLKTGATRACQGVKLLKSAACLEGDHRIAGLKGHVNRPSW